MIVFLIRFDYRTVVVNPSSMLVTVLVIFCFCFSTLAQSLETIDNERVVQLVKSGLSEEIVVAKIRESRILIDASKDGLMGLKAGGASDRIIVELLGRAKIKGLVTDGPTRNYLLIPYGLEVKVLIREKLTSKKLTKGQRLRLEVFEDVSIGETKVITKGSIAEAVVVDSRKSAMMGRSGRLAIFIESTTLVNGQKIKLRAGKGGRDGDNMRSSMVLTAIFGAPGLLMKGTNGQIPANTVMIAQVDEDRYFKIDD